MKSQSELLAQISAAGQRQADALSAQRSAAHERLMRRVSAIKALAPRIRLLIQLGQALYEAKLPISPVRGSGYTSMNHKCDFITDGINHHLGFFIEPKSERQWFHPELGRPCAIGIEGGGYSGFGLVVSPDGEILRGMPNQFGSAEGKMVEFVQGFDAFERDFLAYVESVCSDTLAKLG